MGWINFGVQLAAAVGLYAGFKWLGKCPIPPTATGPYLRPCLKKPVEPVKPKFIDSVKVLTKTLKKAVRVLGWKGKKAIKIQATPTKSRVVSRWIDKKKHCFHRKRRRAPERC